MKLGKILKNMGNVLAKIKTYQFTNEETRFISFKDFFKI